MKTIGIKLADGSFYPVLEEGTPKQKNLELTTAHNNQTKVMVDLYRSANCTMEDAEYVDSLQIENLNAHPTGDADISFTVDGEEYELHMVMIYRADEEERVGLRVIQICHKDASDYKTAGFYSKPGLEVFPGVYCWDCEIVKRDEKY